MYIYMQSVIVQFVSYVVTLSSSFVIVFVTCIYIASISSFFTQFIVSFQVLFLQLLNLYIVVSRGLLNIVGLQARLPCFSAALVQSVKWYFSISWFFSLCGQCQREYLFTSQISPLKSNTKDIFKISRYIQQLERYNVKIQYYQEFMGI